MLRHVSEAFAEDPVRILRVARFAARFGFRVADETMALMRRMVDSGEADYLVPERVWQEFARGLAEPHPERMFEVLRGMRACARSCCRELESTSRRRFKPAPLPVRFALLAWPLTEPEVSALCERLRAPNEVRELALLACRNRERLRASPRAPGAELLELLKRTDALRRPERFAELLEAARLAAPGLDIARLQRALRGRAAVDAGAIAAKRRAGRDSAN